MKRITIHLAAISIALLFSMCRDNQNETIQSKKNSELGTASKDSKHVCQPPISELDSAKHISKTIQVIGDVEYPLSLTVDSLKKMKVATIQNFKVVCESGANRKVNVSCKGILLKDILQKAQIKQQNHKDRNFYIVARATDNYKATFSWAELFNNPTGENVYVLFEENGQPIQRQGDMILICQNDIRTGPRHVYWLKSIEVNRVD
ncbi:MAG TPA: molybdopterin-dependent oxidoreductase [Niabella sp.]|nr:molybdopterin-dependent oxidoreductase [Niabella sp.]HQW14964.1 molybdopterin-dependent oxidoreductase [Niabella sp.]HQX20144.1 molybdopterin-dependent oxidoreductase [Niabella sp.]HRB06749.1 molybdopterin-dependent oxidoreductase [Niabella sp.]HRB27582.1 molybdopterin-dependent oxidoreductase [Niabella sp.]